MRFVKPSATLSDAKGAFLLFAALAMGAAGGTPAFAQAKPAPSIPSKTQAPAAKAPEQAPAKAAEKAPAKAPAKTLAKAPAKAPAKMQAPVKPAAKKEAVSSPAVAARRDPFLPLISREATGKTIPENLPPGPGGLVISTLHIDGIVRSPSGMIAVVSNPQQRVYFIREGANLYDGTVERITLDGVMFRERGKDPFGKAIDRQVMKRLYPRAGE